LITQGWGSPFAPLLPKAIRDDCAEHTALGRAYPQQQANGHWVSGFELDIDYWTRSPAATANSEDLERAAVEIFRRALPNVANQKVCDRLVSSDAPLVVLPLRTRSVNVCTQARLSTVKDVARLTFAELRALPNCGLGSVLDIACCLEAFADSPPVAESDDQPTEPTASGSLESTKDLKLGAAHTFAVSLAAWALQGKRYATIGQAFEDMSTWPSFLTAKWRVLTSLSTEDAIESEIGSASVAALCRDFLLGIADRELAVLGERLLRRSQAPTLESLGERYGVTRERIRQIESRLLKQLSRRCHNSHFSRLISTAGIARMVLGAAIPKESAVHDLRSLLNDASEPIGSGLVVADVILWLMGPYEEVGAWLVTNSDLRRESDSALRAAGAAEAMIGTKQAERIVADIGIAAQYSAQWIRSIGKFRAVDEGWIDFRGSLVDKCRSWIRYRGIPVSVVELSELTQTDSARSLRNRLMEDNRVKRINKQADFALREWTQYDEYTGIADEIAQEIALNGGAAHIEHLVQTISARYGVKPSSVRQYATAPMFIHTPDRLVRVRSSEQRLVVDAEPADCAGCYFIEGVWLYRFDVTQDTLRGSGRSIPDGFAVASGCQPGERRCFNSSYGDIVVSWPDSTAAGASLGSLRTVAETERLSIGDFIFVGLLADKAIVRTLRRAELDAIDDPRSRIIRLMGYPTELAEPDATKWEAITAAVGAAEEVENPDLHDVVRLLQARNENSLIALLPKHDSEETADVALKRIEGLLS